MVDLVTGGDEWRRLARRTRAAQRATQRRGSGRGREQPDRPGMLRAATSNRQPTGPAASTTEKENTMTNPADHRTSTIYDAMHAKIIERLGRALYETTKAVFDADGFRWRDNATRTAIAAHLREIPPDTDLAATITQVITAVYTDHGFAHDAAAVRQAVTRQLDGAGPHGDQPGAQTSW